MIELKSLKEPTEKKKKQKLVKHKHKNWRKTDISDVEKGIDDLRQEQLTGGVRAEKKDEDLFFISKEKIDDSKEKNNLKKRKLTLEEKMNNLGCYRNLKPDPHSALALLKSHKQPEEESKRQLRIRNNKMINEETKLKSRKKANKNVGKNKDGKNEEKAGERKMNKILETDFSKNLWTTSDLPEINEVNKYYLVSQKKILPKKPKNPLYKESAVPKIEVPHPGTSYNPDYDEHQDLLLKAHLVELKKLEDEKKLMRRLTVSVKKMSWDEIEKLWIQEMSVNELFEQSNEVEEGKEENETNEKLTTKNTKFRKNDTKVKRQRRQLLEKIKKRQQENEKKIRIQKSEILRIKSIKKEVDEKEKEREEKKLQKEIEEKHKELFMPKRLGRLKYEEPELDLQLSEEITGNLRTLKPEGNIMRDRYKNLQKRNIIEPRERAKSKRKYWKKKFEKRNAYEVTHYIK